MPKVSKLQAAFTAGQISPTVTGRVDNPRYEMAMALVQNYLPIIQGPLIRRPGTKFVTNAKNSNQPPTLIPFQFSTTQNYMIEAGDKYFRFYQNEGQIVTSSNSFLVSGLYSATPPHIAESRFTAIRPSPITNPGDIHYNSSLISPGTILEIPTPYEFIDLQKIKYTQKQDTLYLTHPSYPPYKLIRTGVNTWDLKQVFIQDGPYLPLNSYLSIADNPSVVMFPSSSNNILTIQAGSTAVISNTGQSVVNSGAIVITTATNHGFSNGQRVCVTNVFGTVEANNVNDPSGATFTNSSITQAYWVAGNVTNTTIDLLGSKFQHIFVNTSVPIVAPALFQLYSLPSGQSAWTDVLVGSSGQQPSFRNIALINQTDGHRYFGKISSVNNASKATVNLGIGLNLPDTTTNLFWQLGSYNAINGYPSACCFHQDRLTFAGAPGIPQELDASVTGNYETFSASGSNLQVNNNNALQFNLSSQDLNAIKWIKSATQGLLAGTSSGEWAISPNSQSPALTPTSINATQTTFYGSYDADAIQAGAATIYIQRAQRKVRELLYFWQVNNFKSTNLAELAETFTLPTITKLVNQKEPHPVIWCVRSDGVLLSMTYNRDDVTLQTSVGWAQHLLGGQSDSAGTQPLVKSVGVIPSGDTTYDELWLSVQRWINSSQVSTIEFMTKPFDQTTPQEQSYHFDCGAVYNSSIVVTGVSIAGSAIVTAPNHGITNSSVVRFYNTIGLNIQTTDVNGNVTTTNRFNENTFVVNSVSTNAFFIQDFLGNYINTNSCSVYVGSAVVNQLVTSISGITWLENETVGVLADGGIQANAVISNTGVLTLNSPAAIVAFGYPYSSQGQMLRTHEGSAQGTSIGSNRRVNRVAFMLNNVGDFSFGPTFTKLIPAEFEIADGQNADAATPLFSGVHRDGIESGDSQFTDSVCFQQNSGLPGQVLAIVRFLEENDV